MEINKNTLLEKYPLDQYLDEMVGADRTITVAYKDFWKELALENWEQVLFKQNTVQKWLKAMGITFNVYTEEQGAERVLPLDIIPRIIDHKTWLNLESGLKQRIKALNLFLTDIYNDKKIIAAGVIPKEIIMSSPGYLPQLEGFTPPKDIWIHITGTDLIRDQENNFMVLEDNLRCPSGVSYMLENREILKKVFPNILKQIGVCPVSDYPTKLYETLCYSSNKENPVVAVLSPGIYNSAYFEHAYLAQQMGVELVESSDLVVKDEKVWLRTTEGLQQIDVIYRRIDDVFLDPDAFREDSMIGVKGIFEAYKKGNVVLANAPGTGIADDKAIYAYVPQMIEFYLSEEPILANVNTFLCENEQSKKFVIENIATMVVKETNEAGGKGMIIGPKATQEERIEFIEKIKANPRNYIAQPTINLSKVPCIINDKLEGRHVDLRPYILYKDSIEVIPGGLTRVALREGSLVVNSSQGGGTKDTWILNS